MCKICNTAPVYILQSGQKLCKNCFTKYIEKKVVRTITTYKLFDKKDNLVVAISGGKDSLTCLHILNKIQKKRRSKISAILIDEGIKHYRDSTIKDAKKLCRQEKIQLKIFSFKKEFKNSLDEFIKTKKIKNPCTLCGILRRYLINKAARKLHATKLATGHNLDDEAQAILMNQFKGNIEFSAKLGPKTGVLMHEKFIPRIKPLYFITEKETALYSKLKGFITKYKECPYTEFSFRGDVSALLNNFEAKYPGTKNSIVTSFLEILPLLRKKFQRSQINTCKLCKEPAAKEICRHCELLKKLKII